MNSTKGTARLENWFVAGSRLVGDVFADSRHRRTDGEEITTDTILRFNDDSTQCETSNTVYHLGVPA